MRIEVKGNSFDRIDKAICSYCKDVSRSEVLKNARNILLNSAPIAKFATKVKDGDVIEFSIRENPADDSHSNPPPLDIVYEDESILVIDKPAGITVHHGAGQTSGTVEDALFERLTDGGRRELEEFRFGIVHRLDKETSGLLIAAKTAEAAKKLIDEFKNRRVFKEYKMIVKGILPDCENTIRTNIRRNAANRKKFETCNPPHGKEAVTRYSKIESFGDRATLASAIIETGRTHQIRVHMQSIGHPVIGDTIYSRDKDAGFGLLLHAVRVGFRHPDGKGYMEFTSPLPDRFGKFRECAWNPNSDASR